MDRQMPELYAHWALTHYKSGNYQSAVDDFTKAIAQQPSNANLYQGRGAAYQKLGDFNRAIADCNQAIKINRVFADAYYTRANAYYSMTMTVRLQTIRGLYSCNLILLRRICGVDIVTPSSAIISTPLLTAKKR